MSIDHKDPILDACLEEVLGDLAPPDMTSRIMQALDGGRESSQRNGQGLSLPPQLLEANTSHESPPSPLAAHHAVPEPPLAIRDRRARRRPSSNWINVAVVAGVIALGVTVGLVALKFVGEGSRSKPDVAGVDGKPAGDGKRDDQGSQPDDRDGQFKQGTLVKKDAGSGVGTADDKSPFDKPAPFDQRDQIVDHDDQPGAQPKVAPLADADVIALVNAELKHAWAVNRVEPAAPASDDQWCRRTFQRILGRSPTDDELKTFVQSKSAEKRQRLVDSLLADQEYADAFARHWSAVWANVLIGPRAGSGKADLSSREGLLAYLRASLLENKPLDEMGAELIAATGANRPGTDDFNGATNYLLATINDKATNATVHTARIFLGRQLQCAQCHDHPQDERLSQRRFWEMNACFRQMDLERSGPDGGLRLVNTDFVGEGDDPAEALVYFENAQGEIKAAWPAFDGREIARSGFVRDVDRRQELAQRIVQSGSFGRAVVNRVWAFYFGYGLAGRPDDVEPRTGTTHAELLARLSDQFAAHDYDMKRLMRWIALSDAFGLSDSNAVASADDPARGNMPLFSRYYDRSVQPVHIEAALAKAAKAVGNDGAYPLANVFARLQGDDPGSIIISPSPLPDSTVNDQIGAADRDFLRRIATSKLTYPDQVRHVFLSAVGRAPSNNEMKSARELHDENSADTLDALKVVWMVLINSDEYHTQYVQ